MAPTPQAMPGSSPSSATSPASASSITSVSSVASSASASLAATSKSIMPSSPPPAGLVGGQEKLQHPTTPAAHDHAHAPVSPPTSTSTASGNYRGFVAGIFSGMAKLTVGHPFDTIKVRMQTTSASRFAGPLSCITTTFRHEGLRGFYKGATPPLIGWIFMDSIMLGSLTEYRRLLNKNVFNRAAYADYEASVASSSQSLSQPQASALTPPVLPPLGHALAGTLAGWTVSTIATPVEHIKSRLQIQYSRALAPSTHLYTGPIHCAATIARTHGVASIWNGFFATCLFRTFFCVWWGSYDVLSRLLRRKTSLSEPAVNFWAGGLSAQLFWLSSYPADVVKQQIMTDELDPSRRKYASWREAAVGVYRRAGWRGYWRGFVPCFLRAFPANGAALVAFEGVMRALK